MEEEERELTCRRLLVWRPFVTRNACRKQEVADVAVGLASCCDTEYPCGLITASSSRSDKIDNPKNETVLQSTM
jgi:hypothetical protein